MQRGEGLFALVGQHELRLKVAMSRFCRIREAIQNDSTALVD